MKKLLVLTGLCAFLTASSFAAIEGKGTADVDTLRGFGYSESTVRMVDTVRSKQEGVNGNYTRQFKNQRKHMPYHKVKRYVDPIQDDGLFGEHQVNFSNTFLEDETHYSTPKKEVKRVENL